MSEQTQWGVRSCLKVSTRWAAREYEGVVEQQRSTLTAGCEVCIYRPAQRRAAQRITSAAAARQESVSDGIRSDEKGRQRVRGSVSFCRW